MGVDGSGKSTAAKWLARELTASGTAARYFENGGGRPLIDALARRLGRQDGRQLLGRRGYLAVEASIRWVAIARALTISTLTRRVAVMDRYSYCQYAIMRARGDSTYQADDAHDRATSEPGTRDDRAHESNGETSTHCGPSAGPKTRTDPQKWTGLETGHPGGRAEQWVRRLYAAFPHPDATFYLAVPPDAAARRVEARGRDLEDPAYLAAFDAAYRSLPEFAAFAVIDASVTAGPVATTLRDHLAAH
ncbi:thymidylate kinase [Pseudofrankia sp. BMG5.36]|uniref:dTMP kinase n=1 Tax=Pseudofrankia sp. BMG5.36 TaxID=1834512 RepID=UPI001F516B79|nr:thymidylate kinase [Pseudofrankia sp. BMG5.36]